MEDAGCGGWDAGADVKSNLRRRVEDGLGGAGDEDAAAIVKSKLRGGLDDAAADMKRRAARRPSPPSPSSPPSPPSPPSRPSGPPTPPPAGPRHSFTFQRKTREEDGVSLYTGTLWAINCGLR